MMRKSDYIREQINRKVCELYDINYDERKFIVQRNFVRNRVEESTKNGKTRKVDISPMLLNCIKQYRRQSAASSLAKGTKISEWIFPSTSDRPLNSNRWRSRIFNNMLDKAKLRKVRIHDLRHSYASFLIRDVKADLLYVKEQLGHSSIKVTVDIYGHLLPGKSENPVDFLDGLISKSAPYTHPERKKALNE